MIAVACCSGTTATAFTVVELKWDNGGQDCTDAAMSLASE